MATRKMQSYHAEKWCKFIPQNATFLPFLAVMLNHFKLNCLSHQSTLHICHLGHEKFDLFCCLVAMVTNHVSNLLYISLQIHGSCCYGDCLFELWFILYFLVRSTFYNCLILPTNSFFLDTVVIVTWNITCSMVFSDENQIVHRRALNEDCF